MKSSETVLAAFYNFLIQQGLDQQISGKIYVGHRLFEDQDENVEIGTLTNFNSYVQTGILNLNFWVKSQADNTPDLARVIVISEWISDNLKKGQYGNYRFDIEQQSGLVADIELDKMYYKNFRFNFQTIA